MQFPSYKGFAIAGWESLGWGLLPASDKSTEWGVNWATSPIERRRPTWRVFWQLCPWPWSPWPKTQGNKGLNFQNRLPYKNPKSWKVEFTANKWWTPALSPGLEKETLSKRHQSSQSSAIEPNVKPYPALYLSIYLSIYIHIGTNIYIYMYVCNCM